MQRQEGEVMWWMFFLQLVPSKLFKTTAEWSSQEFWSEQTRQPIMPDRSEGRGALPPLQCKSHPLKSCWGNSRPCRTLLDLPVWLWCRVSGEKTSRKLMSSKIFFFQLGCLSPKITHLLSRQDVNLLHRKECPYFIKLLIGFAHWLLSETIVIWN